MQQFERMNVEERDENKLLTYLSKHKAHEIDFEVVKALVNDKNIDVNCQDPFLRLTPLMFAIKRGMEVVFDMLIDHPDIDLNIKSRYDRTALQIAVMKGKVNMAKALIERNATISHRFKEKWYQAPFTGIKLLLEEYIFQEKFSNYDILDVIVHSSRFRWHKYFSTSAEAQMASFECVKILYTDPRDIEIPYNYDFKYLLMKACANGMIKIFIFLFKNEFTKIYLRTQKHATSLVFSSCFRFLRCHVKSNDLDYVKDCLACAKIIHAHSVSTLNWSICLKFSETDRKKYLNHIPRYKVIREFYNSFKEFTKPSELFFFYVSLWISDTTLMEEILKKCEKRGSLNFLKRNKNVSKRAFNIVLESLSLRVVHLCHVLDPNKEELLRKDFRALEILKERGFRLKNCVAPFKLILGTKYQSLVVRNFKRIKIDFLRDEKDSSQLVLFHKNRVSKDSISKLLLDFESKFDMLLSRRLPLCLPLSDRAETQRVIEASYDQNHHLLRFHKQCSLCSRRYSTRTEVQIKFSSSFIGEPLAGIPNVCEPCWYFQTKESSGRKISAFELTKRAGNEGCINMFHFLQTDLGRLICDTDLLYSAVLFQNLKIDSRQVLEGYQRQKKKQLSLLNKIKLG